MPDYDVFNGDADGICALLQLRHAAPRDARLVTGVKRDIALLDRIRPARDDRITVLDVSLAKNVTALESALEAGAHVFYADHHAPGDIPRHGNLEVHIDVAAERCTSLIVNDLLEDAYARWAIVGAFGDNLQAPAEALADRLGLSVTERRTLRDLGTYINYNGYGLTLDDLLFEPAALYRLLLPFRDPFEFIQADREVVEGLRSGYHSDMAAARSVDPTFDSPHAAVFLLPDAAWARRVGGVFGNALVHENPARAHAVVTERGEAEYQVSVRAPLENRTGAEEICSRFATGGGRKAAAGINRLPMSELDRFVDVFSTYYRGS